MDLVKKINDSFQRIISQARNVDKDTIYGLSALTAIVVISGYYVRPQTLKDVKVAEVTSASSYCGDGAIVCFNPVLKFVGVEECFEDRSFKGCYTNEHHEAVMPQVGDALTEVTYRNPILPPWGCSIITDKEPSREEQAGLGRIRDRLVCMFR